MKTIGLIGGMSWESTAEYYRHLNRLVRERLGGLHSAKCMLVSMNFAEIAELQRSGEWEQAGRLLAAAAATLEQGGADAIVLCTNTMHKVAGAIEEAVSVPLLHIVDVTAARIRQAGLDKVGLLGTRFTMEDRFYRDRMQERFGIQVLIPEEEDRNTVHRVIFDELCSGIVRPESRKAYQGVVDNLLGDGAQGIILGCTEISLLLRPEDTAARMFDSTLIHAEEAISFALNG